MNKFHFSAKQALLILVLLTVLPAGLLSKLEINNAPGVYLSAREPAVQIDAQIRKKFPQDQVLILLFEGDDLYEVSQLTRIHQLTQQIQSHDFVEKVMALTTVEAVRPIEDGFEIVPLVDIESMADTDAFEIQQSVLTDRFAPNFLASEDGRAIAVVVRPKAMGNSLERQALVHDVDEFLEQQELRPWFTGAVGQVAIDVHQLDLMMQENKRLIPITLGSALFLLWWMFRRVMAVVVGLVAMNAVSATTLSLFVLSGQPYTLVSTMMPSLLGALTVALLVHFYNSVVLAEQSGYQGAGRFSQALKQISRPALFTTLTTAFGLASLSLSPIVPIRTFGLLSAVGVWVLFVVVIFLVPPLFAGWDTKSWSKPRLGVALFDPVLQLCSQLACRFPVWVLLIFTIAVIGAAPRIADIHTETNFLQFFAQDAPIVQNTRQFQTQLSGVTSLELLLSAQEQDGLLNAQTQNWIRSMQIWLEAQPEVDRTLSMAEYVEEMHWAFHAGIQDYRAIPQRDRLVSQYIKLYDGVDLYDLVDRDFAQTRILISVHEQGSAAIRQLMQRIRGRIAEDPLPNIQIEIAGDGRLFADQEALLIQGQLRSLIGALLIIFICLLFLWRSFSVALLCMIPNISPIFLIFVVMGASGIWLDMATAMIASVAVGIAVDDTIHLFHHYAQSRQSGKSVAHSMSEAITRVGGALVVTTLILSVQFALLTISGFKPIADFGLLTTLGMIVALLFDLLLLPSLVVLAHKLRLPGIP